MPEQLDCPPCEQPVTACAPVVAQPVCVTAKITVTPKVRCKTPTVICVGAPRRVKHGESPCPDGTLSPKKCCRTTIAQNLLIKVPVEFGACVTCEEGDVFCLQTTAHNKETLPETRPSRFLFTRSADFFQHQLFPANFTDKELCQAIQTVVNRSLFLGDLLAGYGCVGPGEPCPNLLPLSCLTRLEALLTPTSVVAAVQERFPKAPPILGLTARQLLAALLNTSLATNTPLGLVGGLSLDCAIDLKLFDEAAALLGQRSTVGALLTEADAALIALDAERAQALEPALAAVNTEGSPSIMLADP